DRSAAHCTAVRRTFGTRAAGRDDRPARAQRLRHRAGILEPQRALGIPGWFRYATGAECGTRRIRAAMAAMAPRWRRARHRVHAEDRATGRKRGRRVSVIAIV